MKTGIGCGLLLLTPFVHAAEIVTAQPTMRDAATHDNLAKGYQKASMENPLAKLKPSEGGDPSKVNQPENILSRSEIISFNGWVTLVPKRAVLNLPASYKARMKAEPGSRAVGWSDFYSKNRGWITTVEVTREQAQGDAELGEKLAERVRKSSNLVVATYKGGPISVLPVKQNEPTETEKKS